MDAKRAIRKSGYTQRELAQFLGIDEFMFSKKASGWRGLRFTRDEINTLALYGVPVSELFAAPEAVGQEASER